MEFIIIIIVYQKSFKKWYVTFTYLFIYRMNRGAKHKLTMDWSDKLRDYNIDEKCANLNNNSTEIQYKEGSAKFDAS